MDRRSLILAAAVTPLAAGAAGARVSYSSGGGNRLLVKAVGRRLLAADVPARAPACAEPGPQGLRTPRSLGAASLRPGARRRAGLGAAFTRPSRHAGPVADARRQGLRCRLPAGADPRSRGAAASQCRARECRAQPGRQVGRHRGGPVDRDPSGDPEPAARRRLRPAPSILRRGGAARRGHGNPVASRTVGPGQRFGGGGRCRPAVSRAAADAIDRPDAKP